MSRRVRNLAITAAAPLAALLLIWSFIGPDSSSSPGRTAGDPASSPSPSAVATETQEADLSKRLYSIDLYRLSGLSPATLPGTGLEIWVSWSERTSDELKLQRLIRRVTIEQIEPGPTPEAPSIVTLRVPNKEVSSLIWGDLFGELAVAVLPD